MHDGPRNGSTRSAIAPLRRRELDIQETALKISLRAFEKAKTSSKSLKMPLKTS